MSVNLEKLEKAKVSLDKKISLVKESKMIDLHGHIARVGLVLDYSGSMINLYQKSNGTVQDILNRIVPLALKFDDNGELDTWIFSDDSNRLNTVNINNFDDYVYKILSKYQMGGTRYNPVLEDIYKFYYGKKLFKKIDNDTPVFIIFITDGESADECENIIRKLSSKNIFIQFIGVGNANYSYLKYLNNLPNRDSDNTGFINVKSLTMDDENLYNVLLDQYVEWLSKK